jgi:hypothetical protein
MPPISYGPTFHHVPWIDGFHRVVAGTDNGVNIRFEKIEEEFQKIATVVGDIDTALSSLGAQVRAPVTIGLTPVLLPFSAGVAQWSDIRWSRVQAGQNQGTFVEVENGQDSFGVLPLNLPDGATLLRIKVLGEQQGPGNVLTQLFQESRTPPFARTSLVSVTGLAGAGPPSTDIPGTPTFDGAANVYYLLVSSQDADPTSSIRLRAFLVTYQEKQAT